MRRFDTLSSLLAPLLIACGGEPSPGETEAVGTGFHELVEPILQAHCQECHREGGGAPFPLLDYPGARARGAAMRDRTRDRSMPPWSAASTAMCQPRLGFHHDPTLSDAEITTLSEWVDRGMPEGDPANAPPPRVFPPPGLPGATHTIAPAAAYRVMAAEKDELRCFVLDPRLDGELLLDGATAVPGDPTLVHHISVFVDESRSVLERAPDGGSYDCPGGAGLTGPGHRLLLNWTPGGDRFELPEGTAMRIPAGAVLVLQIHYHPREDRDVDDRTEVQLRRARKKPSWLAEPRFLGNASGMEQPGSNVVLLPGDDDPPSGAAFLVPAGKSGHVETMRITLAATDEDGAPVPARPVAGVMAHMHWLGVDLQVDVERASPAPGEPATECLLATPRYDFAWQRTYMYEASPAALPVLRPGDRVTLRCTYDNTAANAYLRRSLQERHLSSPVAVGLGESTFEEMCNAVLVYLRPVP